jgi:hypothetical protein
MNRLAGASIELAWAVVWQSTILVPRIVIIDADGKNGRMLNLPPTTWLGAPDWR